MNEYELYFLSPQAPPRRVAGLLYFYFNELLSMPTENDAHRLQHSDFTNPAFLHTENGEDLHSTEFSIRM
jgi:hypothetical protein